MYARAVVFSIAVCFCACTRPPSPIPHEQPPHPPAPRPASCQQIASGTQLQPLLDAAPDAAAFCLAPGRYSGPIRISRGQSIWGPRSAVVATSGEGTTVRIHGKNSRLSGITVSGSGPRFDKLDAGVQIEGEDIEIDDVKVEGATFGILVDKSKRTTVSRCDIRGRTDLPFGLRGDGIRFWEAQDSVLRGNFVRDARDLVTRYSQRITIEDNLITSSRYGMHLMYSRDITMQRNRSLGNVVGTFVMYSHNVKYLSNLVAASGGAAGMGLGVKESGDLTVTNNILLRNTLSVYLDTSPIQLHQKNVFTGNVFRLSDAAVVFHSSQRGNRFSGNSFHDNQVQVRVEGGGDALGTDWEGNDWDDYAGFDFDGDDIGDVPYELRSLSNELIEKYPDLQFLRGTPALRLTEALSYIVPLLRPQAVLVDKKPVMRILSVEPPHGN